MNFCPPLSKLSKNIRTYTLKIKIYQQILKAIDLEFH